MKQLIVNADDFGYTSGVNRAIVQASLAYGKGIISSASLMANSGAFEEAVDLARSHPNLDVGCHLNLVEGHPISPAKEVPGLVGASGSFLGARGLVLRLLSGRASLAEMERECCAQIERLLGQGIQPSHLDTHQHAHLHPRVADAVIRAANRYGIRRMRRPFDNFTAAGHGRPARRVAAWGLRAFAGGFDRRMRSGNVAAPNHFIGFALTGGLNVPSLLALLEALPEGTTELICHPGYADAELAHRATSLLEQREREMEALCDAAVFRALEAHQIRLVSFRELQVKAAPRPRGATSAAAQEPAAGQAK